MPRWGKHALGKEARRIALACSCWMLRLLADSKVQNWSTLSRHRVRPCGESHKKHELEPWLSKQLIGQPLGLDRLKYLVLEARLGIIEMIEGILILPD